MTRSIRLPEDLQERVKQAAQAERRTVNNYIVVVLEDAVGRYEQEHPERPADERGAEDSQP